MLFFIYRFYKSGITLFLFTFFSIPMSSFGQLIIFDGSLPEGFYIGVDSHFGDTDWLESIDRAMKLSYPGEQGWGAMYITIGPTYPDSKKDKRRAKDIYRYFMYSVELKREKGGKKVSIGMKDKDDPNNGTETKETITLTSGWKAYNFLTASFKTADLTKIHVPIEIIFGKEKATVYCRNIKFY